MKISDIAFGTVDWSTVERTEHKGERGAAHWRTRQFGEIRVRMVEYGPGYLADHWCSKGHILLCMQGELHTELEDGRTFVLRPGTIQVTRGLVDPTEQRGDPGRLVGQVDLGVEPPGQHPLVVVDEPVGDPHVLELDAR